jgi:subtilisin family serine protease
VAAALLNNKRHRPRELLVEVPAGAADSLRETLAREYGVTVRDAGVIELIGVRIWHITLSPGQDLQTILARLLQDPRVLTVQPNYIYTPVQGSPQGRRAFDSSAATPPPRPAGSTMPTGAGVKLAVIDTCVEASHTELQGSIAASYDALRQSSIGCQPENHGTAVASLIAGHAQLKGTATGASILPVRAFAFSMEENEVAATSRDIAFAMNWAAKSDAQVMNLSFTGPADPLIERAAAAAYTGGIVLVAAAGNAGPASPPLYPAAYPEVIAVTATNGRRQIYSAANRGKYVSVSARGVDVLVAHISNSYATESGTSFAAAEVSGIVACLIEKRPKAGPDEIRAALQKTATGFSDTDAQGAGSGVVNPLAAVAFVETSVPR